MRFGEVSNLMELQEIPLDTEIEIEEKLKIIKEELEQSPEVIKIAKDLDISDICSIMQFGHELSVEVSKFADKILNSIKMYNVENSSVMLKELTKIISAKDFKRDRKTIEQLLNKYQILWGEIDSIYSRITAYKSEIIKINKDLEDMLAKNFDYYKELWKYTAACSLIIDEIEREDLPYWEQRAQYGYGDDNVKLQGVKYALEMLKHRLYNLETEKMVSLQIAPQIRAIQKGNYKLITTIPIFKIEFIQAVTLKGDACGTAVKVETLENAWKTIMEGIDETERIENENKKLRDEGINIINKIRSEIMLK